MVDDVLDTQKRGRKIAMTKDEIDVFLGAARTCRVATVGGTGAPHVSPLWHIWDGTSLWLYSIVKSQRWTDLMRDPRVAVVVDGGHEYNELHGVEIRGSVVAVGEAPRTGAETVAELETPEKLFAEKFGATPDGGMYHDGRHAWLRLTPTKLASWDFRKLGQ